MKNSLFNVFIANFANTYAHALVVIVVWKCDLWIAMPWLVFCVLSINENWLAVRHSQRFTKPISTPINGRNAKSTEIEVNWIEILKTWYEFVFAVVLNFNIVKYARVCVLSLTCVCVCVCRALCWFVQIRWQAHEIYAKATHILAHDKQQKLQ